MELITVNINVPKPKLQYTVKVNDSLENIKQYAVDNPFVYVFVLYTCSVEDVPSWEVAIDADWAYRVMQPLWIGNIANSVSELLDTMLDTHLFGGRENWEMVL